MKFGKVAVEGYCMSWSRHKCREQKGIKKARQCRASKPPLTVTDLLSWIIAPQSYDKVVTLQNIWGKI